MSKTKKYTVIATLCVLWLAAAVQAYASMADPTSPWHWQLARAIPLLMIATYVSGVVIPWVHRSH